MVQTSSERKLGHQKQLLERLEGNLARARVRFYIIQRKQHGVDREFADAMDVSHDIQRKIYEIKQEIQNGT